MMVLTFSRSNPLFLVGAPLPMLHRIVIPNHFANEGAKQLVRTKVGGDERNGALLRTQRLRDAPTRASDDSTFGVACQGG
jgi:hypothetical protein